MTEQTSPTPFSNKTFILGDLWLNYRKDPEFADFIEYNDLGLPLAYLISESMIETSAIAEKYVLETFDVLLAALDIEDEGFAVLDDLLVRAEENK
jgi:hypothetical protein